MATLVLTVLGDDRAGLVSAVSGTLDAHGAAWERSQMAQLAGKFAGVVEAAVPDTRVDALVPALEALREQGLTIVVERTDAVPDDDLTRLRLELVGADRPGIVAAISALLTERGVGVEQLATSVSDAPMAGGTLFEAHAVLTAPAALATSDLRAALEALADELLVDITLDAD